MKRRGATKLEGQAKEQRREKGEEEGKALSPHGESGGSRQVGAPRRGEARPSAVSGVPPTRSAQQGARPKKHSPDVHFERPGYVN